jgi:hypothetical protein
MPGLLVIWVMLSARSHIESLLKARKLDVTLTSEAPLRWSLPGAVVEDLASTGVPSIDAGLAGGLRRGHLSEVIGGRSSGRSTAACRALAAAVSRGELVALVDTCDRFDPDAAAALGLDLSNLLWIREAGDASRALKAMNLVLQAGGFGLVVLDLADVAPRTVRSLPFTTWFRLARVIEGSDTVALLVAGEHVARSSGGATIAMQEERALRSPQATSRLTATRLQVVAGAAHARWRGSSDRERLLRGLDIQPRIVNCRGR